jgi:hypothetical protein
MDQSSNQKSIFNYVTDKSNYENDNKCNDFTPTFINYIPKGVNNKNIDIDTELKGMNSHFTKCTQFKYNGKSTIISNEPEIKECDKSYKVLPYGYIINKNCKK